MPDDADEGDSQEVFGVFVRQLHGGEALPRHRVQSVSLPVRQEAKDRQTPGWQRYKQKWAAGQPLGARDRFCGETEVTG